MTEPLSPDALTALLLASAHAIAAEASALGPRARVRPAEGSWCANEIIGHLIEAETRGFHGQIRTILAGSEPPLPTWDQPAVAAARNDREKDTSDLLAEFTELRADSLALVRGLSAADLARVGIHPKVGRLAVQDEHRQPGVTQQGREHAPGHAPAHDRDIDAQGPHRPRA